MAKYEPLPRRGHCAVAVGGNVYVWAGRTKDFLDAETIAKLSADLEAFNPLAELWLPTARTTGEAPLGLDGGAIAAAEGGSLYHYGGYDGRSFSSALSRLDLAALEWARLLSSSSGPMAKAACGMLCIEGDVLCVWGGYGKPSGPIQPGSTFIKNTLDFSRGWTNELHLFHTKEGGWSSPALTGTRPSPRASFTLTLIRSREAVLFAGHNGREKLNDVHLIDFGQMCWSELVVEGELPPPREGHAACCLNYNGSHPQLLISGGVGGLNRVLRDCWLLCVIMRRWRKVDLPHGLQPRARHSLTAITLGEGLTVTLGFGGFCKWPVNAKTDADLDPYLIADTTVMLFESLPSRGRVVPSCASPSPPSEWALTVTATSSQLGTGDRVRDKTTQLALREALIKDHSTVNFSMVQQLDEALNKGYIRSRTTTCVAMGAPGTGKTHVRHFLFDQLPPEVRISTACIEQAQRAVLSVKGDDPAAFTCTPVDDTMVKEMAAENIKAGVQEQEKAAPTAAPSPTPSQSGGAASEPLTPAESLDHPQASVASPPELTPSQSPTVSSSAAQTSPSSLVPVQSPALTRLPGTADIMKLLESSPGRKRALEVDMVHFIDSGGQPQYLDMAPPFLHNVSMILAVSKLNERLSDTPNVEYCTSDLMYDLGIFDVSNEDMIVRAVQLTSFHKPQLPLPYVRSQPTEPVCAVVGTFLDKEHECDETRAEKNDRLDALLKPFSSRLIRQFNGEIIFPINGTTAGQPVAQPIASELRRAISLAPCLEIDMPLQWQLLYLELGSLGGKVVLRSDVIRIAAELRFESQEAVEAALRYIDLAHFCIYVPEVLPNVVVLEPDAIHKKSTQLLEEHIKLSNAIDADVHNDQQLQFRNQAIFTMEMLYDLPTEYDKVLLPDKELILLLQYKLLLAELSSEESSNARYFMPSLLPSQSEDEFALPKHPPADPLIVSFPFEMAPPGLFPAMAVALLSSRRWNLYQVKKKLLSPLYKNCIELKHVEFRGVVTLTNNAKEFAVHVSSQFPAARLSNVRKVISKALYTVCEKFSFRQLHRVGFSCRCGVSPTHPAILSFDHTSTTCSRDRKWAEPLTPMQSLWVAEASRDASTECVPEVQDEAVGTELQVKEEAAQTESHFSAATTCDAGTECVPEVQHMSLQTESHFSQGFLRGVDVVARTEFTYTGAAESFEWKGHGFRLHFPENVLPQDESACVVDVKGAISGQFEFPEDTELVSGVYCIYSPHKFTQPVTAEVQHCALIDRREDTSELSFVRAKCSQPSLPYRYEFLDHHEAVFSEHSSFGSVQLTHFSMIGAVKKKRHFRTNYCSQLYYRDHQRDTQKVHFVITKDLELHIAAVAVKYSGTTPGPSQEVEFAGSEIKLSIPPEGVAVGNGGSITPLAHPRILKVQVDSFLPGRRIPSCELLAKKHKGSEVEVFRVELEGAKEPCNYFFLECPPVSGAVAASALAPQPAAVCKKISELDVKNAISSVVSWFHLGEQLGMNFETLEEILRDFDRFGTSLQRSKLVNSWLKGDPEASWSKLCGALERMGENAVAQGIREMFRDPALAVL